MTDAAGRVRPYRFQCNRCRKWVSRWRKRVWPMPKAQCDGASVNLVIRRRATGADEQEAHLVAYSFQQRFREPIIALTKTQTIPADRKRHARAGEQVQLYTGMRTRQCRIIGIALCRDVRPIRIDFRQRAVECGAVVYTLLNGLDGFARADGFEDWTDMRDFWRQHHGPDLPDAWSGVLIRWHGLAVPAVAKAAA